MAYQYRFLNGPEYPILKDAFIAFFGSPMPDPRLSAIAVAQDENGVIKGFMVMQLIAHAEPLWIDQKARGDVNTEKLIEMVEKCAIDLGCRGIVTTESPIANANTLCEINGMERIAGAVYAKRF